MSFAPAAMVFDFDGVIVDSERLHHATMVEVMEGMGAEFSWEFYRDELMGRDDRGAFAYLLERAGREATPEAVKDLIDRKAVLFTALAAAGRVPGYPGAADFVRAVAERFPVGLCSGALRSDIVPVLPHLGLEGVFSAMVTADDVARSKPDPASYLRCVELLAQQFPEAGISGATCLAFEDTPDGMASAKRAGLFVVGIASQLPEARLLESGAQLVMDRLGEWTVDEMLRRLSGGV